MPKSTDAVKVKLLAGRTGVGRRGDVVEYPLAEARKYQALGVVRILGDTEADELDQAAAHPPAIQEAEVPQESSEPESVTDADELQDDESETDESAYKRRPLRQKRRR